MAARPVTCAGVLAGLPGEAAQRSSEHTGGAGLMACVARKRPVIGNRTLRSSFAYLFETQSDIGLAAAENHPVNVGPTAVITNRDESVVARESACAQSADSERLIVASAKLMTACRSATSGRFETRPRGRQSFPGSYMDRTDHAQASGCG